MNPPVTIKHLGLADYPTTFAAMRAHNRAATIDSADEIWLLEHPPVFTQGLAGKPEHVLNPGDIPLVKIDRGGQVTYHGPGHTGCVAGDCYQRLGVEWTEQRLQGQRDPYLRRRVPRERLVTAWTGPSDKEKLARELAAFRERLRRLGPYRRGGNPPPVAPAPDPREDQNVTYRVG